MKKSFTLFYVSTIPKNKNINWIEETARALAKNVPVFYLYPYKETSPLFFLSILNFSLFKDMQEFFKCIFLSKGFITWKYLDLFPLRRYSIIRYINKKWNFFLLKVVSLIIKTRTKIVFLSNYITPQTLEIGNYISPNLIAGDCCDIWERESVLLSEKFCDFVFVNTKKIFNIQAEHTKTYLISAGYFPESLIEQFSKIKIPSHVKNTILFIGNISSRQNFELIYQLVKKNSDCLFKFVCTETFNFEKKLMGKSVTKKELSLWKKIKLSTNVEFIYVDNQNDFLRIQTEFYANVGIIPLKVNDTFNAYSHPIKTYFYFSLGIPIVGSSLPNLQTYIGSNSFYIAKKAEEWQKLIRKCLSMKVAPIDRERMTKIALQQTVEKKVQDILTILNKELASKS